MPAQKYYLIYQDLKQEIEEGVYPPESCIPTEFTLVERYHCSRNTVRRPIQQLQELGYVQSIHGKGVVVIFHKELLTYFRDGFESTIAFYGRQNKKVDNRVLELKHYVAGEREAEMGFRDGTPMCKIKRLRLVDDVPTAIEIARFPDRMVRGLTEEIARNSIYEYIMSGAGEKLISSRRRVTVEPATEDDLTYLDPFPRDCVAVVTSRSYDANGRLVEYSQSRNIPQAFSFGAIYTDKKIPG